MLILFFVIRLIKYDRMRDCCDSIRESFERMKSDRDQLARELTAFKTELVVKINKLERAEKQIAELQEEVARVRSNLVTDVTKNWRFK